MTQKGIFGEGRPDNLMNLCTLNIDIEEMLNLYNRSFPSLQTDKRTFMNRLQLDRGSQVFEYRVDSALTGFSVVNEDGVLLLCVDHKFRNQGIGSELLGISEKLIKKDFDKIHLGVSKNTYLLCGVPMSDFSDCHNFFQNRGYTEKWVGFDMVIDLKDYTRNYDLDNQNEDIIISHRACDKLEIERFIKGGDDLGGWVEFYYNASDLIVAEVGGEIIGAVIVEPDFCMFSQSLKGAGSFGCLGVINKYRKHGIGMQLYQEALCSLKDSGCTMCHIGYTWLDWWYGKLGATKYINYWIGEKS